MIGAIDIGGTKIAVGIVSDDGSLLIRTEYPTKNEQGPDKALALIISSLDDMAKRMNRPLTGIGIGCTGPVDPISGTVGKVPFLPTWEGFALKDELSGVFGVPIAVENDADAAALGETMWGAGRGAGSFFYLTVSTGIGGSLVCNGRLYRGVKNTHPEVGHHILNPDGPTCTCGAKGCWESLASGTALSEHYKNATGNHLNAAEICVLAEKGEAQARKAVTQLGYYLGLGISNLITLYSPEVIAVGGGVMRSRHLFWNDVQKTVCATCRMVSPEKVSIIPAMLGHEAGLLGAAAAWLHGNTKELI